jgi:hypothetical protein
MTAATDVSAAMRRREKVAEMRQVAGRTADPDLSCRLFDFADRWDAFADDLDLAANWVGFR